MTHDICNYIIIYMYNIYNENYMLMHYLIFTFSILGDGLYELGYDLYMLLFVQSLPCQLSYIFMALYIEIEIRLHYSCYQMDGHGGAELSNAADDRTPT